MSHGKSANPHGPIDEARIHYFRPHELEEKECYELSVFDTTPKGDDYIWRTVATFSTWQAANKYSLAEFPSAMIKGCDDLSSDDDFDDDDDDGEEWENSNF